MRKHRATKPRAAIAVAAAGALIMTGCSGHPAFRHIVTGRLVRVGGPAAASPVPLPGKIEARSAAGDIFTASAGRNGRFRLSLPPGVYTVTGRSPLISGGRQPCLAGERLRVTGHRAARRIVVVCSIR